MWYEIPCRTKAGPCSLKRCWSFTADIHLKDIYWLKHLVHVMHILQTIDFREAIWEPWHETQTTHFRDFLLTIVRCSSCLWGQTSFLQTVFHMTNSRFWWSFSHAYSRITGDTEPAGKPDRQTFSPLLFGPSWRSFWRHDLKHVLHLAEWSLKRLNQAVTVPLHSCGIKKNKKQNTTKDISPQAPGSLLRNRRLEILLGKVLCTSGVSDACN